MIGKLRIRTLLAAAGSLIALLSMPAGTRADQPGWEGSREYFRAQFGDRVIFPHDSLRLTDEGRERLDKQIVWLKEHPAYPIILIGRTHGQRSPEYELALGKQHAEAVKRYMVIHGLPAARIDSLSYGRERAAGESADPAEYFANVEIRLEAMPSSPSRNAASGSGK